MSHQNPMSVGPCVDSTTIERRASQKTELAHTALKFPPPPPPQHDSVKFSSPPQRGTLAYGARESGCTTVTFLIQPHRGVDDLLMIGLDEHNGEGKSRLMVRGGAEAREIPSQLRWLADKIEREIGKRDSPSINEYVLSTGGK